ncbi:hypothetical protein [Paracoccus albicereus]|nr:hypothetical protein [Paracoccus albicereus]
MDQPKLCRLYLHPPILQTARAEKLGFLTRLREALEPRGWSIQIEPSGEDARARAPDRPGYALYHMERPTHDRALTFRLAYHYPFWRIERQPERWRWPVAQARFAPDAIDAEAAADFAARLRGRVLPGPDPTFGDHALVPLQGHIRQSRSFQTMSPIAMLDAVAATGRPTIATLHPKEVYGDDDRAALYELTRRHPNLSIGGDTARLVRDCAYVATQNSAVAFDGYILGKPAVLFAQVDFHHIALNVAQLGARKALALAQSHRPPFARYLDWFLRQQSLDMMAPEVEMQIIAALKKGGWPV